MGWLEKPFEWLPRLLDRLQAWLKKPRKEEPKPGPPQPTDPDTLPESIEIFAMPGHGRTSYLWATLFMLRQLSRVWPKYLCWPLDEATGRSLLDIHEKLGLGRLPEPWSAETVSMEAQDELAESTDQADEEGKGNVELKEGEEQQERLRGPEPRHALHLRNMKPWGDRHFVVSDRPDVVFNSERLNEAGSQKRSVSWNIPVLWLLSLSDLDETRGRHLDLSLDELIRARQASCEAARENPFRLIVVLTKGDAIVDLPHELRCILKEDPLARKLATQEGSLFRPHDDIDLSPPSSYASDSQPVYPEEDPLGYFETRRIIHDRIREWMLSNSSGRSLVRRAEELGVDLKFSLISATGSGVLDSEHGNQLATAWSSRRVLDPYFWALEMGMSVHS